MNKQIEEEEANGAKLAAEKKALEDAKAALEDQLKGAQGGAADLTKEKNVSENTKSRTDTKIN